MPTIILTHEQIRVVEEAGAQPIRVEEPINHRTYILLREDVYRQLVATGKIRPFPHHEIPEGILRSQAAFFRDLPDLLADEALRGQWVIYHGGERIGIASSDEPLLRECARRGLDRDQYDIFIIEEVEEVDFPAAWSA